jgi:glycosyltransferase involved in cell wall biosynthesis
MRKEQFDVVTHMHYDSAAICRTLFHLLVIIVDARQELPMNVSLVIPIYNEEDSIEPLYDAIIDALEPLQYPFEIVLVDDGSTDDTFKRAKALSMQDPRVRVVRLRKNFGQTAALNAGFQQARGEVIVTMDGDLQNDPRDIERLLGKMRNGYDVVAGWREKRKDRFLDRTLPSQIANGLIRKVTGAPIRDNGCALRAYRSEIIKKFPLYSEMHRLLPTLLDLAGVQIAQVNVRHHPRQYGESKYGLARVYKVLFDLIALKMVMTSARMPLFGFGLAAVFSFFLSVLVMVGAFYRFAIYHEEAIIVYLGVSILFAVLGVALLVLGSLCLLIYRNGRLTVDDILKRQIVKENMGHYGRSNGRS